MDEDSIIAADRDLWKKNWGELLPAVDRKWLEYMILRKTMSFSAVEYIGTYFLLFLRIPKVEKPCSNLYIRT